MKTIKHIFCFLILSGIFFSCSDEVELNKGITNQVSEGLTILIPSMQDFSTRDGDKTAPVEGREGEIKDLYLYLFKNDNDGSLYKKYKLTEPESESENGYKKYVVKDLEDGTYHPFVVANLSKYTELDESSELKSFATQSELESLILKFSTEKKLEAGWLPMACLDTEIEGASSGAITISKTTNKIKAPLTFLCSKVRYTVLFNSVGNGISKDFGDKSFDVIIEGDQGPFLSNLAAETQVKYNNSSTINIQKESDNTLSNWSFPLKKYAYPTKGDSYPVYNTEESKPDENLTEEWLSNKKQAAWQGVAYIPENLTGTPTTLTIAAETKGNSQPATLTVDVKDYANNDSKGNKRGNMYDIVTKVTNYTPTDWPVTVSVYNWTETLLPVDFVHTYLTLEQTEGIMVTSNRPAEVRYQTDGRGGIKFECSQKQDGKDLIIGKSGKNDEGEDVIFISMNNDINLESIPESLLIGNDVNCYVIAGNIRKLIKVNYDIEPFFNVNPESVVFNWNDQTPGEQSFSVETNLGGFYIWASDETGKKLSVINTSIVSNEGYTHNVNIPYVDSKGNELTAISTITLKSTTGTDVSESKIDVYPFEDPRKVAHHYFLLESRDSYKGKTYSELIMVSVIPNQGDYRVYFRAINDYQNDNLTANPNPFLNNNYNLYKIEGEDNWDDWWSPNKDGGKHNLYIYGQDGETGEGFSGTSWHFNNYDSGNPMIGDGQNPGWYFQDLSAGMTATDNSSRIITPGQTLFIFNSKHKGYELHRCSHHNDPGVPLFNYEDREGWYLYDPTRDPYYTVYDDKPSIEDVTYNVYTKEPIEKWYRSYGLAEDKTSYDLTAARYTMHYEFGDPQNGSEPILGKCVKIGEGKYVSQFKLKCPAGEYQKQILFPYDETSTTRIYFDCSNSNYYHGGDDAPFAYIYYSDWDRVAPWDNEKLRMTRIGNSNVFYYDIEEHFVGAKVIFRDDNKTIQSESYDIKRGHYLKYGDNPDYQWTLYFKIKLNGGRNYTPVDGVINGYYDESGWHEGVPTGW